MKVVPTTNTGKKGNDMANENTTDMPYRICYYDYVNRGYVIVKTIHDYYDAVFAAISLAHSAHCRAYVFDGDTMIYST